MGFDRPRAKLMAKAAMRGAYPHPMLVTLVYLLLTAGITSAIMYFVPNPFSLAYLYLLDGYDPDAVFWYVFTPGRVSLFLALEILLGLYEFVMQFGFTSYGLRLARGEQPGYRSLFDGFYMIGRVLLTVILKQIFVWLWSMLALIPYMIVLIVAVIFESPALIAFAVLLAIAGGMFGIAVSYRYRLAYYFLLDNPEMGSLEAITHSKRAMMGWKWSLFVFDLSFLGWALLTPFTLGILSLWLDPYMSAAEANFYDYVVHGAFGPQDPGPGPGGSYGSNYGQDPGSSGQPF